MLNSLVNSMSIWQSEHGKKSMKNDPVKYKNSLPINKKKLKRGYLSIFNTSADLSLTHNHMFE